MCALSLGSVRAIGAAQLTVTTNLKDAALNGQPVQLQAAPIIVGGRTMLPLRETATLLGQQVMGDATQLQIGRLSIDLSRNTVLLNGVAQPSGQVATVGDTLYVSARLLADALGGNLSTDEATRSLTLTALREGGNPLAPQARFSTDKTVYAPGERIVYTEYPFDPDGADITARRWTGRQDTFFQPGTYTIGYQVTNSRNVQSASYTRTIRVEGAPIDTPLTFALKYAEPGDRFPDPMVLSYPTVAVTPRVGSTYPLIFSDSPEIPVQSGILYQDTLTGRARLLGYHLNGLGRPARLYIMARNTETRPVQVQAERQGETAPTRIESVLGQVTLLDYFSSAGGHSLTLQPGEAAAIYASPTLNPGSGANVMQDILTTGRVEITFIMLEEGLPPTAQVIQQLPYLKPDGKHVRGTFAGAVRSLRVDLRQLPARIVIGDGVVDPTIVGMDMLTRQPQRLSGNYGVLYDLEINGTAGTAIAFSPRGGLYRGAMNIQDGLLNQTIKLPRLGNALLPDQPVLLWRSRTNQLKVDFVPASGSNLPISLIFYRSGTTSNYGGLFKNYNP